MDYESLAEGVEQMREVAKVMVNGLTNDGFTEDQARWITVGILTNHLREEGENKA